MKVYSSPIPVPRFDIDNWQESEKKYEQALRSKLFDSGYRGNLSGEVIRFQVADGHAQYMVAHRGNTLALVHMALGDAYSIPAAHIRGLTKADVVSMIAREAAFTKLLAVRQRK